MVMGDPTPAAATAAGGESDSITASDPMDASESAVATPISLV
jgi:hypothetical protein